MIARFWLLQWETLSQSLRILRLSNIFDIIIGLIIWLGQSYISIKNLFWFYFYYFSFLWRWRLFVFFTLLLQQLIQLLAYGLHDFLIAITHYGCLRGCLHRCHEATWYFWITKHWPIAALSMFFANPFILHHHLIRLNFANYILVNTMFDEFIHGLSKFLQFLQIFIGTLNKLELVNLLYIGYITLLNAFKPLI